MSLYHNLHVTLIYNNLYGRTLSILNFNLLLIQLSNYFRQTRIKDSPFNNSQIIYSNINYNEQRYGCTEDQRKLQQHHTESQPTETKSPERNYPETTASIDFIVQHKQRLKTDRD